MSALGHKRPIFHVAMALQNGRYTPESDQKLAISDRPPPANYASSRCLIFWSLWGEEQTFAATGEMTLCAKSEHQPAHSITFAQEFEALAGKIAAAQTLNSYPWLHKSMSPLPPEADLRSRRENTQFTCPVSSPPSRT